MSEELKPTEGAIREAKLHPNGYVYVIVGNYDPDGAVPPEAIKGAWKVDANVNIVGEFIPNPNFKSQLNQK